VGHVELATSVMADSKTHRRWIRPQTNSRSNVDQGPSMHSRTDSHETSSILKDGLKYISALGEVCGFSEPEVGFDTAIPIRFELIVRGSPCFFVDDDITQVPPLNRYVIPGGSNVVRETKIQQLQPKSLAYAVTDAGALTASASRLI
jgi:hypothetical protein